MRILGILRLKDAVLFRAMQKAGWSMKELSRQSGVSLHGCYRIVSLAARPSQEQADSIQRAFGKIGIFVDVLGHWPETFSGLGKSAKIESEAEIPESKLLELSSPLLLPEKVLSPDENMISDEDGDPLVNIISTLRKPYGKLLELKASGRSNAEIGKELGLAPTSVVSMTTSALRMARANLFHPKPQAPAINVAEAQAKIEQRKLEMADAELKRAKNKALRERRKAEALKAFE
jgi:hypothetical protein